MYPTVGLFHHLPIISRNALTSFRIPRLFTTNRPISQPASRQGGLASPTPPNRGEPSQGGLTIPLPTPPPISPINSSSPKPSILNPKSSPVIPPRPWGRAIPSNPSTNYLDHSSASPSGLIVSARLISSNQTSPLRTFLTTLFLLLLLTAPVALVIWTSYLPWPTFISIPPQLKLTLHRAVANLPLPKTPTLYLNLLTSQLQPLQQFNLHLTLTTTDPLTHDSLTILTTGPVNFTDLLSFNLTTNTKWQTPALVTPLTTNAQFIYHQGGLYLLITKADDFNNFHFNSLINQPVSLIVNPLDYYADHTTSFSTSQTPGQLALTKIRNQKLHRLISDYYQLLIERATLPDSQSLSPITHNIQTHLTTQDSVNFFKEIFAIFQESQPVPLFSQIHLQQFYKYLENNLDDTQIDLKLDPQTYQLAQLELNTQIYLTTTENLTTLPNHPLNLNLKINLKDYVPQDKPPLPSSTRPASQVDWRSIITHPLLQLITPISRDSSPPNP